MANLLRQVVDFLSQRLLSSSRQQLGGLSQLRVGRLTDVRAFRTSPLRTFPKVKKKPDALRVPSTKSAGPEGCPTVDKALAGEPGNVYSRENANDAHIAKVLTEDEARRIAANIAKLPAPLGKES